MRTLIIVRSSKFCLRQSNNCLEDQFHFFTQIVCGETLEKATSRASSRYPTEMYRCKERINDLRKDFGCMQDSIMDHGVDERLILATGNNNLHMLMKRLSDVPIIFIKDKTRELLFEAYHRARKKSLLTEVGVVAARW